MDPTSGPIDLQSLGFIPGVTQSPTPGLNTTYPDQNPAPIIFNSDGGDGAGFWSTVKADAGGVVDAAENGASDVYQSGKNIVSTVVGGVKNGVTTVYDDTKGGISTLENHTFIILIGSVIGISLALMLMGNRGLKITNAVFAK